MKRHKTILSLFLVFVFVVLYCICTVSRVYEGQTIVTELDGEEIEFTVIRKPNNYEIQVMDAARRFVKELSGISFPDNYDNIYWVEGLDNGINGLNHKRGYKTWIFLDKDIFPLNVNSSFSMMNFGATISHESDHYFNESDDPETYYIDKKINKAYNNCEDLDGAMEKSGINLLTNRELYLIK